LETTRAAREGREVNGLAVSALAAWAPTASWSQISGLGSVDFPTSAVLARLDASASFERGVVVMDLATNSQIDFIPVGLGLAWSGALSGDGSVLTVGRRGRLRGLRSLAP
jgi:hypothetical protein